MRLRLGTRRSKLALAQAAEVASALGRAAADRGVEVDVEIVPIVTSGDRAVQVGAPAAPPPARAAGLKGLFVHEIVVALLEARIDLAVHSAKDLPADDPEGVVVAAIPGRSDPRDVLVTREEALPAGSAIGTSSLRRRAQLLCARPDARVVDLQGNVDTRLRRMAEGEVGALVLAAAGLVRLGLEPPHVTPFDVDEMVPAPGQGALAVQTRTADAATLELVVMLDDAASRMAFEAERRLVLGLGGGCAMPLGALAQPTAGGVSLRARVIRPDGTGTLEADAEAETPVLAADRVAASLLAAGAAAILDRAAGR